MAARYIDYKTGKVVDAESIGDAIKKLGLPGIVEFHARIKANTIAVKGDYDGICYRTACNRGRAIHFNTSTKKHYCPTCADQSRLRNGRSTRFVY